MPSVGMRRSTRVLGARVLRSGRRLWTEPREGGKYTRAVNGENKWTDLLDNSADDGGNAVDGDDFKNVWEENESGNGDAVEIVVDPGIEEFASEEVNNEDKMFGKVYTRRKRKRVESVGTGLTEDKRFGKKFVRKQWRRKCHLIEPLKICGDVRVLDSRFRGLAIVVNESSYDFGYWVASFLTTVLSYMSRVRIGVRQLSKFVLSRPILDAYSSRGVLFLQDTMTIKSPGFCIIWGCRSLIPLFTVDFSAIPFSFIFMHTSMSLRSVYMSCLLVTPSMAVDEKNDMVDDSSEPSTQIPPKISHSGFASFSTQISPWKEIPHSAEVASCNDNSGIREFLPKSSIRNIQLKNSRNIKKRRSSLKHKRGRPPSTFRAQKASGASLASDFVRIRNDSVQLSPSPPSRVLRSSGNIKELNSDVSANCCSANLLIIETDKCYREEGVIITLELSSSSNQWFLSVVKKGIQRYSLPAQRVMRPACCNRYSHATVWAADPTWKLEFNNKQDWLIFKELYKKCSDRNVQAPPETASVIPVPGVQEVSSSVDSNYVPYVRPYSYITVEHDELTRALVKKYANYDMDSDDEEWLAKFNSELRGGSGVREFITPESFELIIDALEKGFHSNQDEHFDEQAGYDFCAHLERREVIDAIHNYWVKKRKQKRSALVRIFQLYQPRRTQVIPKSVLRKKRSFKRQASQGGRGKQRTFLQAMAAEQDTWQKQNNTQKVQEAKAAAERSEGLAILKRQRAQMLMENADLATYKAMMALRIAEAAQITETIPDKVSSFLLS
ncbi:hypothetical protein BUALT_Bualt01G0108600 [Buddleja alternifolia]|uniref:Enhancer of polycomb-like protein n=1 Tax=Buddleja alternifolia TaxID=168488 RepID=A0AAV6Y7J4_9LAMI|nr:hypothetical protein BUALT_Bualt01G0108600 [Buddleja alternifolia]